MTKKYWWNKGQKLENTSCLLNCNYDAASNLKIFDYTYFIYSYLLSDFINLTQVHNFTVSAQDSFTFRQLSVFSVSFTRILQVLMQIMNRLALYY